VGENLIKLGGWRVVGKIYNTLHNFNNMPKPEKVLLSIKCTTGFNEQFILFFTTRRMITVDIRSLTLAERIMLGELVTLPVVIGAEIISRDIKSRMKDPEMIFQNVKCSNEVDYRTITKMELKKSMVNAYFTLFFDTGACYKFTMGKKYYQRIPKVIPPKYRSLIRK
jgi:hypothetical protein